MSERKAVTVLDAEPSPSGHAAKLPALGTPELSVAFLARMKEQLEVLTGQRGPSKLDRAVTFRDLGGALPSLSQANRQRAQSSAGDALIPAGQASTQTEIDRLIRSSAAYQELSRKVGSLEDLETFPDEIRAVLRNELGKLALERGAAIEETRTIVQEATRSYAVKATEVTASLGQLAAGVRHVDAAYASKTRAFATSLTQVTARLDNADGPSSGVTLEEKFIAQADVNTGLLGQYSVKIMSGSEANPVIAGFALSSETPVAGMTTSAFTILADKFGLYTTGGTVLPFAVSGSTVYINGLLKVGSSTGSTLQTLTDGMINFVGDFSSAPAVGSYRVNDVYKNTSDGNSYILKSGTPNYWSVFIAKGTNGTNGSNGSNGSNGTRGTVQVVASGSSWSDTTATDAILSATGTYPIAHDQVTITNGTSFAQTRAYIGGTWSTFAAWINGNMIVDGTLSVSGDVIAGGTISGTEIDLGGNFYVSTTGSTARIFNAMMTRCYGINSDAPGLSAFKSTSYGSGAAFEAVGGSSGNALTITSGVNAIVQNGGGSNYLRNVLPATDNAWSLGASGVLRWTAVYATSSTITTSDVRTKTGIVDSPLGLSFITALRPVSYLQIVAENIVTDNWVELQAAYSFTDDFGNLVEVPAVTENQPIITPRAGSRPHFGLIAQEVKQALDDHGQPDAAIWALADKTNPDSQQALRYEELIAPLIRAVQELSAQNQAMMARIAVLEGA